MRRLKDKSVHTYDKSRDKSSRVFCSRSCDKSAVVSFLICSLKTCGHTSTPIKEYDECRLGLGLFSICYC
jgi:hypothetical protein